MTQPPSARATVRRDDRASYDQQAIADILDEAYYAHVGFVSNGSPVVIPMLHARIGHTLFLHGGPASRIMRTLKDSPDICVTVTLLDGLVLARSAFHHSANYRSVVAFGRPTVIVDLDERRAVLDAYTDKLVPDRRPHLREMTDKEVRGTVVLSMPLDEASAKVRTGGPIDDAEDMDLDIWAGVIPLSISAGEPIDDPLMRPGIERPAHVEQIGR
jgi:nitroimidazol reductase NimA-like FMN-containing flavoprotein (pyridoxamine 5'-phosphate oxidase superfamily)